MEAIIERCCGLDVHRDSITACVLIGEADAKPEKQLRQFGTMRGDLVKLREWMVSSGCTHVAMESTGVYWMSVYKVLEGHCEQVVGNAQHLGKVPGRKTDVLDSEWLAELLRHGLIRNSFIPSPPIRELRDLTRYRRKLVDSRSSERNRLQKLLETANIKLASVMSDVFGASGMAMLRALVDGDSTPEQMAQLARGQLRKKIPLLEQALDGGFEEHHRYLLKTQLERLEQADRTVTDVDARIDAKLEPYREQHTRLTQIPGVSRVTASVIIAELGADMTVFESAEACASWAGVCPGNNESAGKRKRGPTRRGNSHLKTALVEAAQSAVRKRGSYLRAKFHKLRARLDYKKAIMAIAHKILTSAYHMLAKGEDYRELGETYLDNKQQQRVTDRLVSRLEKLGYDVKLEQRTPVDANALPVTRLPVPERPVDASSDNAGVVDEHNAPSDDAGVVDEHNAPMTADASEVSPRTHRSDSDTTQGSDATATAVDASSDAMSEHDSVHTCDDMGPDQASTQADVAANPAQERDHQPTPVSPAEEVPSEEPRDPRIPPSGTILTRVYKGDKYQVSVLPDGFEYRGDVYPTLSSIATKISGYKCSGYQFFHLNPPRGHRKDPPGSHTNDHK